MQVVSALAIQVGTGRVTAQLAESGERGRPGHLSDGDPEPGPKQREDTGGRRGVSLSLSVHE